MVLHFTPAGFEEGRSLYQCPILLSFMCILVRDDPSINLAGSMHTGEIYAKMLRCLLKKYTMRKGLKLREADFKALFMAKLKAVGKFVWDALLTDDPLLEKSEVIEEVGEDAFDLGWLIGNEDSWLLGQDRTADICITFPHRSLQEFWGAFFFVLLVGEKNTVNLSGIKGDKPYFLMNPLFFHFCLWFLYSDQQHFIFEHKQNVRDTLCVFTSDKIDLPHFLSFDLEQFPALQNFDELATSFLTDVFAVRQRRKHVVLRPSDNICKATQFLGLKPPRSVTVRRVYFVDSKNVRALAHAFIPSATVGSEDDRIAIAMDYELNPDQFNALLDYCKAVKRHPCLFLSDFACNESLRHCSLAKEAYFCSIRSSTLAFPVCPQLTRLTILKTHLISIALCNCVREGRFPVLSHLTLADCYIWNDISELFRTPWPKLSHLHLHNCNMRQKDLDFLLAALRRVLPELKSLALFDFTSTCQLHLTEGSLEAFKSLQCLSLGSIAVNLHSLLENVNNEQLRLLDLSGNPFVTGQLKVLLGKPYPVLIALLLNECALDGPDLNHLAQASAQLKLPRLNNLGVSGFKGDLEPLFACGCTWDSLLCLNIASRPEQPEAEQKREEIIPQGCLSALRKLAVSSWQLRQLATQRTVLGGVQVLKITDHDYTLNHTTLNLLTQAKHDGFFPALHTVQLVQINQKNFVRAAYHLRREGVITVATYPWYHYYDPDDIPDALNDRLTDAAQTGTSSDEF